MMALVRTLHLPQHTQPGIRNKDNYQVVLRFETNDKLNANVPLANARNMPRAIYYKHIQLSVIKVVLNFTNYFGRGRKISLCNRPD